MVFYEATEDFPSVAEGLSEHIFSATNVCSALEKFIIQWYYILCIFIYTRSKQI